VAQNARGYVLSNGGGVAHLLAASERPVVVGNKQGDGGGRQTKPAVLGFGHMCSPESSGRSHSMCGTSRNSMVTQTRCEEQQSSGGELVGGAGAPAMARLCTDCYGAKRSIWGEKEG
jgi:hypothetical protein